MITWIVFRLLNFLRVMVTLLWFFPHVTMRKRSLCCGSVFIPLSVSLSVTFVHSIQTAEDIVKLLCWAGRPVILVF